MSKKPHLAILGAGPTGLEAALAATAEGYTFTLYEAAPHVAGHIASWAHVRLFTPWSMVVSAAMRHALTEAGHNVPTSADDCPTGGELRDRVLVPLAQLPVIAPNLRCGVHVRSVGRRGLLKHESIDAAARAARPFRLLLGDGEREWVEEADAILDCTGNSIPNALGDGGIPAPGEATLDGAVVRAIPDLGLDAAAWAGRRVLLLGAGHSAQTAVRDLAALAAEHPGTELVWALRGDGDGVAPAAADPLPERAALAAAAGDLLAAPPPALDVRRGVVVDAVRRVGGAGQAGGPVEVTLRHRDGETDTLRVDRILALVGQVGDHLLYRQLQVHECYATAGPMKLAAALMGASGRGGDCLAQTSLGAETLTNPEPGFFLLGAKSYGRRNDYLMRVGYEQVGEVFELLADD